MYEHNDTIHLKSKLSAKFAQKFKSKYCKAMVGSFSSLLSATMAPKHPWWKSKTLGHKVITCTGPLSVRKNSPVRSIN